MQEQWFVKCLQEDHRECIGITSALYRDGQPVQCSCPCHGREAWARHVLREWLTEKHHLHEIGGPWVIWLRGSETIKLDGTFTAEGLEAMAWWMRHKGGMSDA